jgi:hypothetical protein
MVSSGFSSLDTSPSTWALCYVSGEIENLGKARQARICMRGRERGLIMLLSCEAVGLRRSGRDVVKYE